MIKSRTLVRTTQEVVDTIFPDSKVSLYHKDVFKASIASHIVYNSHWPKTFIIVQISHQISIHRIYEEKFS